jgi:hypothetical protein
MNTVTGGITWKTISDTMLQSDDIDATYQISRSSKQGGRFIYRAWHRRTNRILAAIECVDERGDRAAAVRDCKAACEMDARGEEPVFPGEVA